MTDSVRINELLDEIVNSEEVSELLLNMVRTPSINYGEVPESEGTETRMAELVVEFCKQNGIKVEQQEVLPGRPNVICSLPGKASNKLAFCAHMDTVPPDKNQFTDDPNKLNAYIEGNRVYGRGSCDTKASLVSMLIMLKTLKTLREKDSTLIPNCEINVIGTMDEEHNLKGANHLVNSGFKANGIIVGEPTSLRLMVAHGGCVRWKVTTKGKAAHSSKPNNGINAIYGMQKVLEYFEDKAQQVSDQVGHYLVGPPALSVTTIVGGSIVNIVPDSCTIEIDRRLIPGEDPVEVWEYYKNGLEAIKDKIYPAELEIEKPYIISYALDTSPKEQLVKCISNSIKNSNENFKIFGASYATEGSTYSRFGIPAVVFGPGDIGVAHTPNEYAEIEEIVKAIKILSITALDYKPV